MSHEVHIKRIFGGLLVSTEPGDGLYNSVPHLVQAIPVLAASKLAWRRSLLCSVIDLRTLVSVIDFTT